MLKIKDILKEIELYAPLPLQEGFDNAGLQVGDVNQYATGALLCLDVTEEVIDEAIDRECNLIISHHPLAFKPFKSLTGSTYIERCLIKACKHDLVIYAAHTNLDNLAEGVNHKIAEKIGLRHLRILSPKEKSLLKLVTFVPMAQAGEVREALFKAGCGCIGRYDACSYNVEGEGTFRAGAGTRPFCGQEGELHQQLLQGGVFRAETDARSRQIPSVCISHVSFHTYCIRQSASAQKNFSVFYAEFAAQADILRRRTDQNFVNAVRHFPAVL